MVSEFVAAGYIPGENAQYSLHRFRFTVNGESRPEFEVFFNDRLGGAIKTVDAILFVPAGARVGIEVRYFYENGTAIPDFTENANMMGPSPHGRSSVSGLTGAALPPRLRPCRPARILWRRRLCGRLRCHDRRGVRGPFPLRRLINGTAGITIRSSAQRPRSTSGWVGSTCPTLA